jgi:chemotaxis protein methyltransferase CheR
MPVGPFDLILCRNLAFTYFELNLQRAILRRLEQRLAPEGVLVVGAHESLPGPIALVPSAEAPGLWYAPSEAPG